MLVLSLIKQWIDEIYMVSEDSETNIEMTVT